MYTIGIIGATGHTGYVLDGVRGRSDLKIVGVSPGSDGETVETLLQRVREACPEVRQYGEHEDLLDDAEPDIVAVAPYFGDIASIAKEVLSRDIHAFVEKPLATRLDDLETLRSTYEASEGRLAAMLGIRYNPAFRTAATRVHEGAIGEVRLVNARKSYKLGRRGEPYLERETYGGTIPWVGIHAIDWINWVADDPFRAVTAHHTTAANRDHGSLETTAVLQFELGNDVLASASVDYLRPETAPTHGDDFLRVVGTEGVIRADRHGTYLIDDAAGGQRELPLGSSQHPFEDFVDAMDGTSDPLVTADASFEATRAALLARQAADEQRRIEW